MTRATLVAACTTWVLGVGPAPAGAQQNPQDAAWSQSVLRALGSKFGDLIDLSKELNNWDEHAPIVQRSIERMFKDMGWTSEPDQFALSMMREVESIPPWEFQRRFSTAVDKLSERWGLDDDQRVALEDLIVREGIDFFSQHSDELIELAGDVIRTRVDGEPVTPEHLQDLTQRAYPIFQDAMKRFDGGSQEILELLTPEQREKAAVDIGAANKRLTRVEKLGADFVEGRASAEDLGLEALTTGASPQAAQANPAGEPATAPVAEAATPTDAANTAKQPTPRTDSPNDPWALYVRAFIARYGLLDDQQQVAWVYYRDARDRADAVTRRTGTAIPPLDAKTPEAGAKSAAGVAEMTKIFERLKSKLDRLPTRKQREKARTSEAARPAADAAKRG